MMPKSSHERSTQVHAVTQIPTTHLEHQSRTLRLLVTTKLEVLAALQCQLALGLALDTFQAQNDLLRGLRLLVEDGLGLTTVTALLAVVTALTLGEEGSLAGLVLGDLVLGVLAALLAFAVRVAGLGNVDLVRSGQPMSVPIFMIVCRARF